MAIGSILFSNRDFQWTDIAAPRAEDYAELSGVLDLPESIIQNCLNPDYLPHVENYGSTRFVILRVPEPFTDSKADSVQELTTKIALFICEKDSKPHIISIHRISELAAINEIKKTLKDLEQHPQAKNITSVTLLGLFFEQMALAFESPITTLEQRMETFEEKIFNHKRSKQLLQEGYYLKRKASAYRKVLKYSLEIMNRLATKAELWQDTRDKLERYHFYADDIFENTQGLLGLHLSIASQRTNEASYRTNEIMRVLTVLTIFFLPLNFIAGVFGMNFSHIPWLQAEWGFWLSLALMAGTTITLFIYVIVKGWLAPADVSGNGTKNE